MADKKIPYDLGMVTTPEQQLARPRINVRKPRLLTDNENKFNVVRLLQKLCVLVIVGLLSLGCYMGVSHYFLESVEVVGESMLPTLAEKGQYILNRWAYHSHKPERGDIVVIRDPGDKGFSVKRIVALAGEAVHFKNGKVFVNGKELVEPYLPPNTYTFTYSQAREQFITCGKDRYFVMGDNRLASIDSRAYGPVPKADILGLVIMQ